MPLTHWLRFGVWIQVLEGSTAGRRLDNWGWASIVHQPWFDSLMKNKRRPSKFHKWWVVEIWSKIWISFPDSVVPCGCLLLAPDHLVANVRSIIELSKSEYLKYSLQLLSEPVAVDFGGKTKKGGLNSQSSNLNSYSVRQIRKKGLFWRHSWS